MAQRKKLRYAEYYDMQPIFDKLYEQSGNGKSFTNLMELIAAEKNIKLAYRNIKRNDGSYTSGTDRKNIIDIEKMSGQDYIRLVRGKLSYYKPKPVKRVEIEKPNGGIRPLGIPTILDRLIQQCIKQVLEPICEAKFYKNSYGFRPLRSAENAMATCYRMMQLSNLHIVIDIDIKGFFDNVNHSKLIKQMWSMGIRDKQLLCIIKEMLKAPIIMPDSSKVYPDKGTPQGGILSPLLSNIVLNELDWWVASQWELLPTRHQYISKFKDGRRPNNGNKYVALRNTNLKEVYIVRYADDFKIFCRKRSDANKMFVAIKKWLHERLKLEISEEKSKIVNLKKHYSEFLGFKLKVVPKKNRYVVKSHMNDKAVKRETEKLKTQIEHIQKSSDSQDAIIELNIYNSMVIGIHNYYGIATCINDNCIAINRQLSTIMRNRFGSALKKHGEIYDSFIKKKYGRSKQIRFLYNKVIVPMGYISTRKPFNNKYAANAYTKEGRAEVHDELRINTTILKMLMRMRESNRSIEYLDNRISLYAAQYGKCAVTGKELSLDEIHCHHKVPLKNGGDDSYRNLVIVHRDAHMLIHAIKDDIISKYLDILQLNDNQIIR